MRASRAVHMVGTLAVLGSVAAWVGTGTEGYTRWPNARLEQADAPPPPGQNDLLAEAGFSDNDKPASHADIRSRFAFGLVPGGMDPKHLLSVATIAALAGGASGLMIGLGLWRKASHKRLSVQGAVS